MSDQQSPDDNVITFRDRWDRTRPEYMGALGSIPPSANDRCVADGMRLISSFMAIEDEQTRASIIRIVEEIAQNAPVFRFAHRD